MTTKYTFKQEFIPEFTLGSSPTTITMEINGDLNLTEILERFEEFLRGAGFRFDGYLDFVEHESPSVHVDSIDNMGMTLSFPDGTTETVTLDGGHSHYYFDTDRNK